MPLRRIYIPKAQGRKTSDKYSDYDGQGDASIVFARVAARSGDDGGQVTLLGSEQQESTADAIENCFIQLGKTASAQWILEGDIKGCFDNISHAWLLDNIPMDRSILRKWLKTGFMGARSFNPTDAGTPQGGLSATSDIPPYLQ